jgi:MFS transporter, PPP family, 3-phenylpropionic acid transporter
MVSTAPNPPAGLHLATIFASPSTRITLVLALLFGGFGVAMPFLPRWLEESRGLDSFQIAIVLSVAQMARVVVGPLIAAWADGFTDRSMPIKLLALATLCAHVGYFWFEGFVQLLLFSFAAGTTAQAIVPLAEGATLRASLRPNGLPHGPCRAVGSGVFIAGTVAGGFVVQQFGVPGAPLLLLALLTAMTLSAWAGLLGDPAPLRASEIGYRGRLRLGLQLLHRKAFAYAIAAAAVVQASHAFFYNFTAIVWRDQGVGDQWIGFLIAFGVLVEIALLAALPRVEKRFQPEALIAIGAGAAIVRWAAFASAPPIWLLWPLQGLHALTFAATHVGAMRLIQREAPEEVSGLAQTLYAALAAGLFMGLAGLLAGALHQQFGAVGYAAMAGLACIGLALIAPALARRV